MGKRVLVAATGSVATVKVPMLASELIDRGCEVRVVMSETARHFLSKEDLAVVLREARSGAGRPGRRKACTSRRMSGRPGRRWATPSFT